jgi:hypothetical protein
MRRLRTVLLVLLLALGAATAAEASVPIFSPSGIY